MGLGVNGIQNWGEVAGLILSILLICGVIVGAISWFNRLESKTASTEEKQKDLAGEVESLETRVETKLDTVQTSINTILIQLGEIRGEMRKRA